jgi:cytochrome c-type biogenesis protein CcmH/NrfG
MKAESIAFGVAGAVFGLIVGWIIGTQQGPGRAVADRSAPAAAAATASVPAARPALDEGQVSALKNVAQGDPANAQSRVQLGNVYFDAERYQDAIRWYDEALKLSPKDVNVSTDLGVCYYYTDQPDRAVRQLEESLRVDPRHLKTLLNLGVVKAFGKQDLAGAMAAWQQVIAIDPHGEEGQSAQRMLSNLQAAHPGGTPTPPPGTPAATQTPKAGGPAR